jgi:Txe/YoeB family toxin of Txe-Axe toxin-antitoxin module
MIRYAWFNINTGNFSDSWDEELQKSCNELDLEQARNDGYKLIKYECLNDNEFELYSRMKVVTKSDDKL